MEIVGTLHSYLNFVGRYILFIYELLRYIVKKSSFNLLKCIIATRP